MSYLVSFGTFSFAQSHILMQPLDDNFNEANEVYVDIPGMTGAYDPYGREAFRNGRGRVTLKLVLDSMGAPASMESYRDAIKALQDLGEQKLIMQPSNPASSQRWCMAKVVSVKTPQDGSGQTDNFQPVTITWSVAHPRWLTDLYEARSEWETATWDSADWGTGASFNVTAPGSTVTITYAGNRTALPRFEIVTDAGETISYLKLERLVNGVVVDRLEFTGAIPQLSMLEINCRAKSVKLNSLDAYSSLSLPLSADWFRFAPGNNTIRTTITTGSTITIRPMFYEEYS